jgi:hypothetical protein
MLFNISASSLKVYLKVTPTEQKNPYGVYHLEVKDLSGKWPDKVIPIVDLGRIGGGITLEEWKLNWNGDRPVISVYLQVSMMGHDLDQWAHYDWETGERIKDFEKLLKEKRIAVREAAAKRRVDKKLLDESNLKQKS